VTGHTCPGSSPIETLLLEEPKLAWQNAPVVTPIYKSSTYILDDVRDPFGKGYIYSRYGNPNVNGLEEKLATLEAGEFGFCFGSGMAAVSTFCLALLQPGDHVILEKVVYGGTYNWLKYIMPRDFGITVDFVDLTNTTNLKPAIKPNTKLLYLESPTNPSIDIVDIEALSAIAHEHNLTVAIDNTFSSPYLQQPLTMGCDVAIHSLTKYVGGHSSELGGAVILKNAGPTINDKTLAKRMLEYQQMLGGVMSPDTAWHLNQSIKTLKVRMDQHCTNALAVAQFLENHDAVRWVKYPGLASHPNHALAQKQMKKGFGGILMFSLKGGREHAMAFLEALPHPFSVAVSVGGVESLIFPAQALYSSEKPEVVETWGIDSGAIRLSVGIEALDDLIGTLDQTLTETAVRFC